MCLFLRWLDVHWRSPLVWNNNYSRRICCKNNRLCWISSYDWVIWKCYQWHTIVSSVKINPATKFLSKYFFFVFVRAALEHEQVASIDWSEWRVIVLLAAFTLTLFTYYTITPIVMKITSAMAINLSLLTADFYTLVVGVLLFQFKVSQFFNI